MSLFFSFSSSFPTVGQDVGLDGPQMSRVLQRGRLVSSPISVLERAVGAASLRASRGREKWVVVNVGT